MQPWISKYCTWQHTKKKKLSHKNLLSKTPPPIPFPHPITIPTFTFALNTMAVAGNMCVGRHAKRAPQARVARGIWGNAPPFFWLGGNCPPCPPTSYDHEHQPPPAGVSGRSIVISLTVGNGARQPLHHLQVQSRVNLPLQSKKGKHKQPSFILSDHKRNFIKISTLDSISSKQLWKAPLQRRELVP